MKKCVVFLLISVLLTGCGTQETFETVADEIVRSVSAQMREVVVSLPQEAAAPVSESDSGTLYQCDGYEITLQTLESGDLDATIQSVSGYSRENLTVIETSAGDYKRFDLAWSCAGETGDRIGKAAILDDGNYHYVLCVLADAERVREYEGVWQEMFDTYTLG